MTRLSFLICLFFIPLALQAQVYRCDTAEGTIYSQMPCADNAERLVEYDTEVETDDSSVDVSSDEPTGSQVRKPSAMENFVSTLEKQRSDQFESIDASISTIQQQLEMTGSDGPDERTREALQNELAILTSERASINEQYASLISEASNRASSGQGIN